MAPVTHSLMLLLVAASTVQSKPLIPPGHHAPPHIANILSSSKRSFHRMLARYYYGSEHGLVSAPLSSLVIPADGCPVDQTIPRFP